MISRGLFWCILCVNDVRFLLYTKISLLWFILSSMRRLRYFALIVLVSIYPLRWDLSYSLIVPSSSSPLHKHMNKTRVVERKYRHILDTHQVLLISSSVPRSFWVEVVLTSVNLINITPSSVMFEKSPHERLYFSPPTTTCYAHLGALACPSSSNRAH